MDGVKRSGRGADPAADVVFGTELVLARGALSPREIAAGSRGGVLALPAREDGLVLLEAGGVAIAEGRVVRKGGRQYFKVGRLLGPGEVE